MLLVQADEDGSFGDLLVRNRVRVMRYLSRLVKNRAVAEELDCQLAELSRADLTRDSLERFGAPDLVVDCRVAEPEDIRAAASCDLVALAARL